MRSDTSLGGKKYVKPTRSVQRATFTFKLEATGVAQLDLKQNQTRQNKTPFNNHCPNNEVKLEKVKGSPPHNIIQKLVSLLQDELRRSQEQVSQIPRNTVAVTFFFSL